MQAGTKYGRWPRYYTISLLDVGKPTLHIFGRTWHVSNFMGTILPGDAGKRIYYSEPGYLSVESDDQRDQRLAGIGVVRG